MHQPRMFRLAPEGVAVNAYYEHGVGWHLITRVRHGGETWSDAEKVTYSGLTTSELLDVVLADLSTQLRLV